MISKILLQNLHPTLGKLSTFHRLEDTISDVNWQILVRNFIITSIRFERANETNLAQTLQKLCPYLFRGAVLTVCRTSPHFSVKLIIAVCAELLLA